MRGKLKRQSALGESCMNRFSDRGSTPLGSTKKKNPHMRIFLFTYYFFTIHSSLAAQAWQNNK